MIGVAVLGVWHVHADDYARQVAETAGVELRAVWDTDPAAARGFGESWGVSAVAGLDELLARGGIDAVIVADAPWRKEWTIRAALAAGKHVLTEKLLGYSVAGAESLAALAAARGRVLEVATPLLDDDVVRAARKAISSGELGEVTSLRIRHSIDGLTGGWLPARFMDAREALVGCLGDLGCHGLYIAQSLLDDVRPAEVLAAVVTNASTPTLLSSEACPLDTSSCVTLHYPERGAIAVVEASEEGAVGIQSLALEVTGRTGAFVYGPDDEAVVRVRANGAEWMRLPVTRQTWNSVQPWLAAIVGDRPHPNTAAALVLTETVVRAYVSAGGGSALRAA